MVREAEWQLPLSVVGPLDIGRLTRELETVENFLSQAAIRKPGTSVTVPKTSRMLSDLAEQNKHNLLMEKDRQEMLRYLQMLKTDAPLLHISFATDPSPRFLEKLVWWFRQEIDSQLLLQIGLQPNIGVGCIVRTPNHYFDLSLRRRFQERREALVKLIVGGEPQ